MDYDNNEYKTPEQETSGKPGNSGAKTKSTLERGAEAFEHAEQAVSDAYDKTSEKVSETYDKAKNYSQDNPGKSLLIALGIGVGIGLLLGGSTHRTRTGRLAQPVVHALSDIALAFFR
jgi:ElaB/YqjD/DUF883 family membrane-anchored ribosome-binding protein